MRRFWILLRFELVKVLARKKALLFLLALNVLPIMSGLMAMLVYIKYQGWGLGEVQFSFVVEGVKKLLAGHVKLFALISPFFLALVIGDSFSGESGKGLMKTLLLTPVPRWQVIIAKTMAVMLFLMTALAVGGVFLQFSLFVARAVTSGPSAEGLSQMVGNSPAVAEAVNQALKDRSTSLQLVGAMPALRLLLITFLANLSVVGFFILFSLFFESPILMAFVSLIALMSMETYVLIATAVKKVEAMFAGPVEWCFSRHLSQLFDIETINGLIVQTLNLSSTEVYQPLISSLGWAVFFLGTAMLIFQRREVFH